MNNIKIIFLIYIIFLVYYYLENLKYLFLKLIKTNSIKIKYLQLKAEKIYYIFVIIPFSFDDIYLFHL
jgi:hypothetical protein